MMTKSQNYAGIDLFRIVAAILVISIHTSPFTEISPNLDFAVTRILARVAVPFFLMATGFFLFPSLQDSWSPLRSFLKKTLFLYGCATLLYLPVNLYAGNFDVSPLIPQLVKDLLFDGTFYHLWYLPAVTLGAVLVALMLGKWKRSTVFVITLLLYIIGLFGDSYYGISEQIPWLKAGYDAIFQISDYTRNGVFFAPLFLVMGYMAATQKQPLCIKESLIGLILSFGMMLAEGFLLWSFHLQRHDSMYITLIPCLYFLFQSLLSVRGKSSKILRDISMLIYLVDPMAILLVRAGAKLVGLEEILIYNSLIHFLAVTVCSVCISVVIALVLSHRKKQPPASSPHRGWIDINLNNLTHNIHLLQSALPQSCKIMAVVKANAYGHGDLKVAAHLNSIGIFSFATATLEEAIRLRQHKIKGEILILGHTDPCYAKLLHQYNLTQTVIDLPHALALNATGIRLNVHLKIDTGMHRLGQSWNDGQSVLQMMHLPNLNVSGIYTHLCVSDDLSNRCVCFTRLQIDRFYQLLDFLKQAGEPIPKTHIQSSYGVLHYPDLNCDYARVGIAMYGTLSKPGCTAPVASGLKPVLSIYSRVVLLRDIPAGESAGYGLAFTAQRKTRAALIPIGYADGIPRSLSRGKGAVLIRGQKAPIIGMICMDQFLADVTDLAHVECGDLVTLIGQDGNEVIFAYDVAQQAGTISNELLSRLGSRLEHGD